MASDIDERARELYWRVNDPRLTAYERAQALAAALCGERAQAERERDDARAELAAVLCMVEEAQLKSDEIVAIARFGVEEVALSPDEVRGMAKHIADEVASAPGLGMRILKAWQDHASCNDLRAEAAAGYERGVREERARWVTECRAFVRRELIERARAEADAVWRLARKMGVSLDLDAPDGDAGGGA